MTIHSATKFKNPLNDSPLSTPRVGMRVVAARPNARWGEGEIIEIIEDPKLKPLVVRRDDGHLGYFHVNYVSAA